MWLYNFRAMIKRIKTYFAKRKQRKLDIAEAEAKLLAIRIDKMTTAFLRAVELIHEGTDGFVALRENEEEKLQKLRIKYLKEH